MRPDQKSFISKIFTYLILSYAMALISIMIIIVAAPKTEGTSTIRNIFNILFSTNACFISTTGWSIKKDHRPMDGDRNRSDLVYLSMVVGLLISVAMVVLSSVTSYFSCKVYSVGFFLTLLSCFYLAAIYTEETIQKEQIIEQHDKNELMKKAQEMIAAKEETSVSISGADYKL